MEPFFKAIEMSLGINRQATVIALGGFVVMALAIGLVQLADDDTLTFWRLLVAQVALMLFMLVITQLPLLARRLLAWVVAVCFAATMVTATIQSVTENRFRPPLALASCIISFYFAESCQSSPATVSAAGPGLFGAAFAQDATVAAGPALTGEALAKAQGEARLFIQFAGYERAEVVKLAMVLSEAGWRVEGGERGGERVTTATGLNEVRYFNPGDSGLALALAETLQGVNPDKVIGVQDLSATTYGKTQPGLLEIWVSE
ncbi:MAG: hypothetical protein MUE83_06160 [Tabrizicola sp.]|nr:hypothetical protein [Tabrizicola sp.]